MSRARQPGGIYDVQRIRRTRVRFNHHATHEPVLRRKRGAARSWMQEIQFYAYAKNTIPGTILERMLAKRLDELGYDWVFQFVIDLPQLATARIDFAVFGTGLGRKPYMALEPEGELWHLDDERDAQRRHQLRQLGVVQVQLWEQDMLQSRARFEKVVDDALKGIEAPKPPRSTRRRPDFEVSPF